MKSVKALFILLLAIICTVCCAFALAACNNIDDTDNKNGDEQDNTPTPEHDTQPTEELVYKLNGDGVSYSVVGIGATEETDIVIASTYNGLPVSHIGERAFFRNATIKTITFDNGSMLALIGREAFFECVNLENVTIPDSVTHIDDYAFKYCHSLKSITIPEGVTLIGDEAFMDCSSLETVYWNAINCSTAPIIYPMFQHCIALKTVAIGENVQSIPVYAFGNCINLTSITIPDSVTSINYGAFSGCINLTTMTVSEGNAVYHSNGNCIIETASKTLVSGCKNSVIPNDGTVTSIGNYAFFDCINLESITIPNSITRIGGEAFCNCESLTSIKIPNSVTLIEEYAFYGCLQLSDVTIGNGVTSIGEGAFELCFKLWNITIPSRVTEIGNHAFRYCELISVNFENIDNWHVSYESDDFNGGDIYVLNSDLANPATAAKYLTDNYCTFDWKRI